MNSCQIASAYAEYRNGVSNALSGKIQDLAGIVNLALWLARGGLSHGDRVALGLGTRAARRYGEVAERVARLAGSLRERFRLAPGERVAIAAKNSPDYLELMFAIWHAGLAAVPANAKLHGRELAYILQHSGARVCFTSRGLDAEIAPHAPATLERLIAISGAEYEALFNADPMPICSRDGDDLAWLFYTSGTTGRPKGAMLTHRVLAAASFALAGEVDPIAPGDALLHAAPMSHGSGLYMMATVSRLGVNVVPESGTFDAEEVFRLFDAWPRSSMFAAPTMVKRLVDCGVECNPDRIRTIIWGGAPMYLADALDAIDRFGPRFAQIYGQGESPMTITTLSKQEIADRNHPRWAERLASAGRPFSCVEVVVADGDDRCSFHAAGDNAERWSRRGTAVPIMLSKTRTRPASSRRSSVPTKLANGPRMMRTGWPAVRPLWKRVRLASSLCSTSASTMPSGTGVGRPSQLKSDETPTVLRTQRKRSRSRSRMMKT
jgi:long-chain acyl-CoA synthetase